MSSHLDLANDQASSLDLGHSPHHCEYCNVLLLDLAAITKWDGSLQEFVLKDWAPRSAPLTSTQSGVDLSLFAEAYPIEYDINNLEIGRLNFQTVIDGAERGCEFFAYCKKEAERKSEFSLLHAHENWLRISIQKPASVRITKPRTIWGILLTLETSDYYLGLGELYWAADEGPASQHVLALMPDPSPVSTNSIARVQNWLNECRGATHQHCIHIDSHLKPPTYLLDLTELHFTGIIRLVKYFDILVTPVVYTALSYCWGSHKTVKSMRCDGSLRRHLSAMDLDDIPKTIRDAIRLTKKLGIQYLWVDSVCIVQDDAASKLEELGKMGDIYKGAELTIRAAIADDVHKGFLALRSKEQMSGLRLNIKCPNGSAGSVVLKEHRKWLEWHGMDSAIDPIDARAWTMQEAMLSKRLLSFGTTGLEWACRSDWVSETMDYSVMTASDAKDDMLSMRLSAFRLPLNDQEIATLCTERWQNVVVNYSERMLTYPSDRLAAIAGVAQRIQYQVSDQYVAGFWRSRLAEDLLWYCPREYRKVRGFSGQKAHQLRQRPTGKDRCAPS